jgi:AraC-like DNA-binding protein
MSADKLPAQQSRAVVAQLKRSQIYRDYEQAFRETTGLPIALRPIEAFDLPHHGDPKENPFCSLMSRSNHSCAACLQLCDSAVPVRVGENLVAFLQTGQIMLHQPKKSEFTKATRSLINWGTEVDMKRLEEAYFQTRVVTKKQHESIIRLLTIFAQHLSTLSNQLMVQEATAESPAVAKARVFIAEHQSEELSLSQVASAVNMSAFYFCKTFKKATGMTFTEYLARVRVEKVKNLLLNPHKRVSEAAYEAGFQSLSQFNRVFRRIAGESPSVYRERIHGPNHS